MARFAVVSTFPFGQSRHDCKPCEACQLLPPRTVRLASALLGPVVEKVWLADSGPNSGTRERLASLAFFLSRYVRQFEAFATRAIEMAVGLVIADELFLGRIPLQAAADQRVILAR